ncbi:hypothetical protein ACFOSC_25550 [Streptantibioticus rubrisoli]|uniref:Uncharacterized protein n=1 Tax=Streptantibioticus rubrisoli TaxID=1387313 RepID=A0ABT1PHU4_9ACTN|nr:hypothetical protein [Streptantibioticus rubrisoli]MCQ4044933.1 hypothetical protein [Streptantibioticus rubrisoli]
MAADSRDMPPVRLLPDAELARHALAAPLFQRAVRLARWAAPQVRIDAAAELAPDELARAVTELGLEGEPEGDAEAADAWAFAVDTGLVEAELADEADRAGRGGTAVPGKALELLSRGGPRDVLELWRTGLDAVLAEAAAPGLPELYDDTDGEGARPEPGWDPEEEAEFLDGALANLYLLTAIEAFESASNGDASAARPVPLPVLAASMVVPEHMEVPTDAALEEVSEAMMRLDDHFRLLAPTGAVDYHPVDDALISDEPEDPGSSRELPEELGEEEVSRYGMVRLTPLGVLGVRDRLTDAGVGAPAVGDLAGQDAAVLLDALVGYPEAAAYAEGEQWLAARQPVDAARELLAAARGRDQGAPARRLVCQQTLSRLGIEAEPALREVLDDRELGGLARVWLVERAAADVPSPDEEMVFWLTVDTIAAQLDVDDDPELLRDLVNDLVARHDGFFDAAWRVDHPSTAEVLEAMGRLHPDRKTAKEARKAAFKARSAGR